MKKPSTFLVLSVLMTIQSCQKKQPATDLEAINLLRGDIALCGNNNFGEVSFDLEGNDDVKQTFNLGISLLHSFEYEEAEKAFVKVIDNDPNCAMAYWGVAMSNFHALWLQSGTDYLEKGSQILQASNAIPKTEKEADYLDAISGFYENWQTVSHAQRVMAFENRMKRLYEKYPGDKEAAIFYSLALTAAADPKDKSYEKQKLSGMILESIYPDQPNHPGIAHYLIHNYDYPELAELALPTARRYAKIAPASAHAQHMPSHIFTRLGLWKEDIESNLNSVSSALCYASNLEATGHWDEELHGMDYLVYAYLQLGNNAKAIEQYEYLRTFRKVFPPNFKVAYASAAIPARIYLENKNWKEAAHMTLPPIEIEWTKFPWQASILHFTRALGFAHLAKLDSAMMELDTLVSNEEILTTNKEEYQASLVHVQVLITKAWIEHMKANNEKAVQLMQEATSFENGTAKHPVTPGSVIPAGELLGDLLLELNIPEEALKAYENNLLLTPNRFNSLYGAAHAASMIKNKGKALHYFEMLRDQAANSPRVELSEARRYLKG